MKVSELTKNDVGTKYTVEDSRGNKYTGILKEYDSITGVGYLMDAVIHLNKDYNLALVAIFENEEVLRINGREV